MKKGITERIEAFYQGKVYLFVVLALILLGHTTLHRAGGGLLLGGYQEMFFGGLLILSMCVGCFVCHDIRFLILPFMTFIFQVTVEHSPHVPSYSHFYAEPLPLTLIILYAVSLIASVIVFCIRNRRSANRFSPRALGFLGMAVFCGVLLLNGIGSDEYTISNLLYSLSFLFSMLVIYLLFAFHVRFDESVFSYFMFCLALTGLLISAELILSYLTGGVIFSNGSVVKESVVSGWGIWTSIGGMLVFLMPACFYHAYDEKRGWIFYLLGLLEFFCIFLSQSRGALLFGSGILLVCLVTLCVKGKNRRLNRILTGSLVAVGVVGVAVLLPKLMSLLQNYLTYGFDDNGRYEIWRAGWQNFIDHPILGAGFYNSFHYDGWEKGVYPYLYHNTLLQMLASGGVILLGAYLYHRVTTVLLVVKKPTAKKTFLGFCILGMMSFCLLDVIFFNTYPTIIYSLMLLFMDRETEQMTESKEVTAHEDAA